MSHSIHSWTIRSSSHLNLHLHRQYVERDSTDTLPSPPSQQLNSTASTPSTSLLSSSSSSSSSSSFVGAAAEASNLKTAAVGTEASPPVLFTVLELSSRFLNCSPVLTTLSIRFHPSSHLLTSFDSSSSSSSSDPSSSAPILSRPSSVSLSSSSSSPASFFCVPRPPSSFDAPAYYSFPYLISGCYSSSRMAFTKWHSSRLMFEYRLEREEERKGLGWSGKWVQTTEPEEVGEVRMWPNQQMNLEEEGEEKEQADQQVESRMESECEPFTASSSSSATISAASLSVSTSVSSSSSTPSSSSLPVLPYLRYAPYCVNCCVSRICARPSSCSCIAYCKLCLRGFLPRGTGGGGGGGGGNETVKGQEQGEQKKEEEEQKEEATGGEGGESCLVCGVEVRGMVEYRERTKEEQEEVDSKKRIRKRMSMAKQLEVGSQSKEEKVASDIGFVVPYSIEPLTAATTQRVECVEMPLLSKRL